MSRPRSSPQSRILAEQALRTPRFAGLSPLERRTVTSRLSVAFDRGDVTAHPAGLNLFVDSLVDSLRRSKRRSP